MVRPESSVLGLFQSLNIPKKEKKKKKESISHTVPGLMKKVFSKILIGYGKFSNLSLLLISIPLSVSLIQLFPLDMAFFVDLAM